MKLQISILLIFLSFLTIAQEMNDHEKAIQNPADYIFHKIDFMDHKTQLSGTLITPKGDYNKVVIIAPGSGRDTRNCHYILAETLLKKGIAIYRYDDRGVGKSEGRYKKNVKINIRDLNHAFENLKKIDFLKSKKIGIIGHSIGGYAAINTYQKRLGVDFLILMSTPIEQDSKFFNHKIKVEDENHKMQVITYEQTYKTIDVPVLFITGSKDSIVNCENVRNLLYNLNKNIQVEIMEGLNHFLIKGDDSWIKNRDYNTLHGLYEIDQIALNNIIDWVVKI